MFQNLYFPSLCLCCIQSWSHHQARQRRVMYLEKKKRKGNQWHIFYKLHKFFWKQI